MKKPLIFFLFLFVLFSFLNFKTSAKSNSCSLNRSFNNLSTRNVLKKYNFDYLKNIEKICTDVICTYNLDNDIVSLMKRHENNYINNIIDIDKKEFYTLKGVVINEIYFKGCI